MEMWQWAALVDREENIQEVDRIIARKKKGKLETKVSKFRPLRDSAGRYVPYCDFGWHQGYVRTPEICEDRACRHYNKLYIPKQSYGK